jgi:hypothetical protein
MGFDEVSTLACGMGWDGVEGWTATPLPPLQSPVCLLQVFVISLARRPHRRARMLSSLWEMEISGRVVDAVDGR